MRTLFITLISLLLCSCTAGLSFNSDKINALDLHQLKSTEYPKLFGDPIRTWNITTRDGKYKDVWFYKSAQAFFGKVSRHILFLEFKDDQLNAYIYISSFDIDKTRIDLHNVDQIKVGTSTKNDVLTVLGKPYGKALCPSLLADYKDKCVKSTEIWSWVELNKTRSFASSDSRDNKSLFVMFDVSGKVIDLKATDNE